MMKNTCIKCKKELIEGAEFCPYCGTDNSGSSQKAKESPQLLTQKYCMHCGKELILGTIYCGTCGQPVGTAATSSQSVVNGFVSAINRMTGEKGKAEIHFSDLFVEVFKHHTVEERDKLVICGTKETTPAEKDMVAVWPKPWLFSRVFAALAVTFIGLYIMISSFQSRNAYLGLLFIQTSPETLSDIAKLLNHSAEEEITVK